MRDLQGMYRCWRFVAVGLAAATVVACASGRPGIERPRPLVVPSGARLQPDSALLDSANLWVQNLEEVIRVDPSFFVDDDRVPRPAYPWETLEFRGEDTVRVAFQESPDVRLPYLIYGFLHLMSRHGRLDEWFPGAQELEGFDLERFILTRTAESWLLGRAVYDTPPHAPLDELAYALDRGHLDAMILAARPEEFEGVRSAWLEENPEGLEEFREWFRETFNRDPPGPSG